MHRASVVEFVALACFEVLQRTALLQAVSIHREVGHKAVKQTLNSLSPLSKDRLSHEPVLAHVLDDFNDKNRMNVLFTMMASAGAASLFPGVFQEELNGRSLKQI